MMATDDDRAEHDGEVDYSQAERDEYEAKLDALDEAKDVFLLEIAAAARKYGLAVDAADSRFILWFNSRTKAQERGSEGVQAFVEYVGFCMADAASEPLDHEEIAKARNIVETGRD